VILAAGAGRRMGGPKALVAWRGRSLLAHALANSARPAVALRIAVLGCEAGRARQAAAAADQAAVRFVVNPRWEDGMLSSVICGLDAAESAAADAVLLYPVDHPAIEPETIDAVCAALAAGADLVVPVHAGRRGHPGGFGRARFAELRAAPPEVGARAVLRTGPVVEVAAAAGCLRGVDTPDELAAMEP
jgi:CTP:molybdopterin cytidylyltransferase MocA